MVNSEWTEIIVPVHLLPVLCSPSLRSPLPFTDLPRKAGEEFLGTVSLQSMRIWMVLAVAVAVIGAVGCTSDVHAAIRDGEAGHPTADSGPLASSTTGGDAAGTLNLDANHQGEQASNESGGRNRRGGGA